MPPSRWLGALGDYPNGAAGKPLLVSLLVYVDAHWQRDWDAETLFLDGACGVGLLVQPRPARAVLSAQAAVRTRRHSIATRPVVRVRDRATGAVHQDVLHRVSTPSLAARRPRYSLVWKLCFVPRAAAAERETICRAEWGPPVRIGG